jgi:hypothetical protein
VQALDTSVPFLYNLDMSKAQCLDCLDILESKHRHDLVKCKCGNAFLDGGDEYIRAGGNIVILDGAKKLYPLRQDPELSELLKDVITDDMFDGYLDDDFDDYNLGYQAGVMNERERILQGIQRLEDQSEATRTPLYQEILFAKIKELVNKEIR